MTNAIPSDAKWLAKVTYKSADGRYGVSYPYSFPEELSELIEAAQEPHKIIEIEILLRESVC
ncbi:MAG: hypothetical protein AB7U61_15195 [Methylocystis sp.]